MVSRRISKAAFVVALLVGASTFASDASAAGRGGGFGGHGYVGHGYGGQQFGRPKFPGQRYLGRYNGSGYIRPSGSFGGTSFQSRPVLTSGVRFGQYGFYPRGRYQHYSNDDFRNRKHNRFDDYGYGYGGGYGGYGGGFGGYGGYSAGSAPFAADGSPYAGAGFEQDYAPPRTTRISRRAGDRHAVAVTTQEAGFQSQASYNIGYGFNAPRTIRVSP